MKSIRKQIIIFIIISLCLITPALAGTKYTTGSPELSAYISGSNEFEPGDDIQLNIVIENHGLNEYKYVQPGIVNRDDLPNTAKFLTLTVLPGNAPIVIKSDSRSIGDLYGDGRMTATVNAKIDSNAYGGTYDLPVELQYTYLDSVDQFGGDSLKNYYIPATVTILLPITIKPDISLDVLSAIPEHLNAGTEGYLNMTIKNVGSEPGIKSIVQIVQNGNSPIIPLDSSVYIGNFPVGSTVNCRYKLSIADSAENQSYPVDVMVVYENNDGDIVNSRTETIGVPVGRKIDFRIISPPKEMTPGSKAVITVEYKNTGDTPVKSAQARISAVDPFTSSKDIAYLGDLNPGESALASYELSVSRSATHKEYGLDSEIRYRDALENTYISDVMKVNIDVQPQSGIAGIISNPVYISIIIAGIIGLIYILFHFRKQ